MSDPLADAANAISTASPNIRAFAQLAAQRIIALEKWTAPLPPADSYESVTNWPLPAFTPTRTANVSSQAQLQAAVLDCRSGDLIQTVTNFTVRGEFVIDRRLPARAMLDLSGATFTGAAAGSQLPNVWIKAASNLTLIGGKIVGGGGDGITVYDSTSVTWLHFEVHDAAAQGVHFAGIAADCANLDFKGDTYNCGLDLTQDPHAEKGTGLHGVYLGGSANKIVASRFAFHVHDQAAGAAVQVNKCDGCTFYVKAERVTKAAQSQVAGNAIQWWGVNGQLAATNCKVPWLEGTDLQGRMSEIGAGVEPSAIFTGNTVLHGRGQRVMLNPLVTGSAYRSHSGIVYTDCQP